MKIIVSPNAFKGSLDAFKVAQAIEHGLAKSKLNCQCQLFPIADGGDNTLEVFHNWQGGKIHTSTVIGPMTEQVDAQWLYIEESRTAVIEMAKASGISLVLDKDLNPLKATSYGSGQIIQEAASRGAQKIILGLGGSATVDAGLGMMQALGANLFNANDDLILTNTNPLLNINKLSLDDVPPEVRGLEFLILCDVENPLLGQNGAAHIFGPQKGANPEMVNQLENCMSRYNEILFDETGNDYSAMEGAGAAGGIAVTLKSFFNTKLESGVDYLLSSMGFEDEIKNAQLLITAEGKVDSQTLQGKGPYGVALKAREHDVPTIILAGKADDIDDLNTGFLSVFPITNGPVTLENAMMQTATDLESTACQIGNLISLSKL